MADEERLKLLRAQISTALLGGDVNDSAIAIADAVKALLQWGNDEWKDEVVEALIVPEADALDDESEDGSEGDSESSSDSEGGSSAPSSYLYRSTMHLPRNPRLEHLCEWLYDTVVHPGSGDEPEEISCQKLPAAILAAWPRLASQQQQAQAHGKPNASGPEDGSPIAQGALLDGAELPGPAAAASASPALSSSPMPPTDVLHTQHAPFSQPFCTWRPVAPDALPPLHDVLVGVLRVCWERHDDRDPARNIIWGAQSHSRRDDPVTAYLYVEYLRLLVASIVRSRAEPLWLWHELQEVIEEYPHWRHHPHEVAVLARMMVEHGCGWRLLNSLLDHIGKAPLLMYGAWAALWDGLRRGEARACARLAAVQGVPLAAVWGHVAELTLLQVKEHPQDQKLLDRAVAVLQRVLALAPEPGPLAALLRAERDAPASCGGVRAVTSALDLGPGEGMGEGQGEGEGQGREGSQAAGEKGQGRGEGAGGSGAQAACGMAGAQQERREAAVAGADAEAAAP
ncbi:hypothetical protein HYH03_007501 [Edaphochlamys debaryana]|uniref:Uncharacterized protein n=1 Tax=Edaphochlamys debaryana TaxID=47281 RepID=A0A835YBE5_9CHLO|nr:hypothetical protein HYH03_007501 [Edaphochlamys debaryana]|eukprot:KAG2494449.1 hypothetical protein HYH03_007501 [Edaphochlamys debaryana]